MDKNKSELFSRFVYDESLTYYDLLESEEKLTINLDKIFLAAGAEHLDFTPLGDMLMFQCAFENHDIILFRELAKKCALMLPPGIRGRLLFLEKNLEKMHLFWVREKKWLEKEILLPPAPPADMCFQQV